MNACLYVSATNSADQKAVRRFVKRMTGLAFVSTEELWKDMKAMTFEVSKPTRAEQRWLWKQEIEKAASEVPVDTTAAKVANQFNLSAASIQSAASEAASSCASQGRKRVGSRSVVGSQAPCRPTTCSIGPNS